MQVYQSHAAMGFGKRSTLTYASYLIGTGEIVARIGASRFTAYAMLVACAAMLLQFALTHPLSDLQVSMRIYRLSLVMAIISTVLPVFMLSVAIRRIGSAHTSLIAMLGPVSTLFMADYLLDEQLSPRHMLGAGLVMLGVFSLTVK